MWWDQTFRGQSTPWSMEGHTQRSPLTAQSVTALYLFHVLGTKVPPQENPVENRRVHSTQSLSTENVSSRGTWRNWAFSSIPLSWSFHHPWKGLKNGVIRHKTMNGEIFHRHWHLCLHHLVQPSSVRIYWAPTLPSTVLRAIITRKEAYCKALDLKNFVILQTS